MTITLPAGMCRQLLDKAAAGRHPSRIAQELGIPFEAAVAGVAWSGAPSVAKLSARRTQLGGMADTVPVEISTSTVTATPQVSPAPAGRRFDRVQLVGIDDLVTDTSPAPIRNLADRIRALVDRLNHGITEDAQHAANRLKVAQLRAEIRRLEATFPSIRRRPPATTTPPGGVHACPHCDQTFTRTQGLGRHINAIHKEHTA